jgi:broad specificity phosphatase PhoE
VRLRTWYLVRHGETEWNAASRIQGQLDSRLTPLGRQHALASARRLATLGVDAAFASPLGRVRETVEIILAELPLAVTFDDRLKEWSAGDWSGELHAEIPDRWPAEWAAWDADRYTNRSPNGENFADLTERARSFVADASLVDADRIAIIAHGFLNRALVGVLLSLPPSETLRIRQGNDTIVRIVEQRDAPAVDHFRGDSGPLPGLPTDNDRSFAVTGPDSA